MGIHDISPYYPSFATQSNPMVTNHVFQAPTPTPTISPTLLQKREVEYVNGVEGATNYPLAANSSALLLDKDADILWVIATDQNGSKSIVKGYHIGDEYVAPKPITLDDLMAQMQSMNDRLTKMEENKYHGKPNFKSSGQGKPNGSNAQASFRNGSERAEGESDGSTFTERP